MFIKLSSIGAPRGAILRRMEKSDQNLHTATSAPSSLALRLGHVVHEHKHLPEGAAGWGAYQFVRSAAAAVPYGISMATTWWGMNRLEGAAKTGSVLKEFAASPAVRASAMIATSFTFYRTTSKTGKWLREYLFDPKDSEAQTIEKMRTLPSAAASKWGELFGPEVVSVPVAALALGFITSSFSHPAFAALKSTGLANDFAKARQAGNALSRLAEVGWGKDYGFASHWLTNTIGYSVFFEAADRIADGYRGAQAQKTGEAPPASEASLPRFLFRRVIPTAAGIGLYTGFKMRNAYQILGDFPRGLKVAADIPKYSWREGAATSLFCFIPMTAEPWEKVYDSLIGAAKSHAQGIPTPHSAPVSPEKAKKLDDLLTQVNAKEQGKAGSVVR